jgi:DNA-binding response OmpR family regulator
LTPYSWLPKLPKRWLGAYKPDLDKRCLTMQLGASDYLKKTVNPNELLEVIAEQLQLFQAGVANI